MAERQFLVRSLRNGTIRTVTARSRRAALDKTNPSRGDYEVKERGEGDWHAYRVS